MIKEKIQIILVDGKNASLRTHLINSLNVHIINVYDIDDVANIQNPASTVPDFLVVINTDDIDKRKAVINAMILRNNGHQVILSSSRDINDLLTLVSDVFFSLMKIEDKTSPFRTEIMVTEVTTRVLGDISLIVKDFENNLRHNKPKN